MITISQLIPQPLKAATLLKRALLGAVIAYVLITVFLLVPGIRPNPGWPKFWVVRPLLVVPFAGAMGGIFYHIMDAMSNQGGWKKTVAVAVSFLVYIVGLWLGTVLGLAGTLWN